MDDAGPRAPASTQPAPIANTSSVPTPAPATTTATTSAPRIQQPTPHALPSRSGPSSILVSPRQKGNPILNGVRAVAWEYSDIPADYVLGATTCALFLSLKYHRLHPEYIYNRIRDLKGQYGLRILLTMVDIENHEAALRELSKTSLINNVTIILCWNAQEAGRYLELFKTFEHAAPTSIRGQQSSSYSDKLTEFITVPRSINKTDALGLVSNFGSIRTAVNAGPEEVGLIAGWGEKKVQRWCGSVRDPFRIKRAAKRIGRDDDHPTASNDFSRVGGEVLMDMDKNGPDPSIATRIDADKQPAQCLSETPIPQEVGHSEEESMRQLEVTEKVNRTAVQKSQSSVDSTKGKGKQREELSEGVMAALNRLRQT
ncbi:DNA repair protein rad10, partial [Pleomassaria siparia CBS 279.74]